MEDELVHHDQVADGEGPGCDALGREVHHGGECAAEDNILACVEKGEGGGDFDAGFLIGGERFVVPCYFVFFIVEVLGVLVLWFTEKRGVAIFEQVSSYLNSFVVEQRIHCCCGGLVVCRVCLFPELGAP